MAKSSVGFKDSVAAAGAMMSNIEQRQFAPVYLLMGEEGFFIDRVADALARSILSETEREFSQLVVYGKDNEAGSVVNFARQMPMLGSRQVVIVREAQSLSGFEGLDVYVRNPSPTTVLVLCYKGKSVDKRSAVYKSAAKNGVVLESVRPREYEIGPWLSDFVKDKGLKIDPRALGMIVDNLGTDIATISNELDKLMTALGEDEKMITVDHVQENVGISKEFNNYELTRAISEGDSARALMIAGRLANDVNPNWLTATLGCVHPFSAYFHIELSALVDVSSGRGYAF